MALIISSAENIVENSERKLSSAVPQEPGSGVNDETVLIMDWVHNTSSTGFPAWLKDLNIKNGTEKRKFICKKLQIQIFIDKDLFFSIALPEL